MIEVPGPDRVSFGEAEFACEGLGALPGHRIDDAIPRGREPPTSDGR